MGADQRYSLKWNNYQSQLVTAFDSLLTEQEFVDVTLGVEGRRLPAHKMLLSACSPYFRELLRGNPCQHPIIIIRDLKYEDVSALLQFMYNGEVNVAQESLNSFLKSAESLKIRGLTENEAIPTEKEVVTPPAKRKRSSHERNLPAVPETSKFLTNTVSKLSEPPLKQEVIELTNDTEEVTEDTLDYGDPHSGALVPVEEEEELLEIPEDRPQGFWQNLYDVNPLEEGRDIFSCEICGKEFRNEGSLAQHKPIHRVNTTCQICGTTLSRVQHYRRHLRTVHNIDPKLMGRESETLLSSSDSVTV